MTSQMANLDFVYMMYEYDYFGYFI